MLLKILFAYSVIENMKWVPSDMPEKHMGDCFTQQQAGINEPGASTNKGNVYLSKDMCHLNLDAI